MNGDHNAVLYTVVFTLRQLLANVDRLARFPTVRVVRLGSEPLYRQDVEKFRELFPPGCLLVAGYGASETGVGRLRPDGCLKLLGRRDHQVKVRGYRISAGPSSSLTWSSPSSPATTTPPSHATSPLSAPAWTKS